MAPKIVKTRRKKLLERASHQNDWEDLVLLISAIPADSRIPTANDVNRVAERIPQYHIDCSNTLLVFAVI